MKLLKNRFFLGALCIVAGLIFSFIVLPSLYAGNQGAYIDAVRMKADVRTGTQIGADMIEVVSVPEKLVKGAVKDTESVIGRYTNTDLFAGDYLTTAKITETLAEQDSFLAGLSAGKTVVSVTLPSLAAGVSGRLLPGDIVTVMVVPKVSASQSLGVDPATTTNPEAEEDTEPADDNPTESPKASGVSGVVVYPELEYVEVCMVSTNDGADAVVDAQPGEDKKNTLPVTVSFYVNREQALKLAELEQQGSIHLAFVARGEGAHKYLPDSVVIGTEVG